MKYNFVRNEDFENVAVVINGELYGAGSEHPNWKEIKEKVLSDDEEGLADLFDPSVRVAEKFKSLSDRVTVSGGHIYFDGDRIDNVLSHQVLAFVKQGVEDWKPLVNFYERLMTNLNEHTREQLYRWLADRHFEITEDGKFLAYKGLREDMTSVHSGPAIVDGESLSGHVPNNVGSVISMPRSQVQHDSSVGCSTGLHAGTWDYARSFGKVVVKVLIDPVHVVSVPTDCSDQKLRVCEYKVLEVVERASESLVDNRWGDEVYDTYTNYEDDENDYDPWDSYDRSY